MNFKEYYEYYNRDDPSSTYRPEHEATFTLRLAWFSKQVPSGAKVLEYGCGEGVALAELAKQRGLHQDSCGVDISERAVRKATDRFPHLKFVPTASDGTIPFKDGSFDVVVASEVIEHVFDTDAMFQEFARVLRPAGSLLLSCPYHGFLKDLALLLSGQTDGHYHNPYSVHIRYYSVATLQEVLRKHGFRPTSWGGVGRLPFLWKSVAVAALRQA